MALARMGSVHGQRWQREVWKLTRRARGLQHVRCSGSTHRSASSLSDADAPADGSGSNFLRSKILKDVESGAVSQVSLRFPPEPNGFLHVGHAKSICLNFGLAQEFNDIAPDGSTCFLRFDDTNPLTAHQHYADSIMKDVQWLGFQWDGEPKFSSDYFETLHSFAVELIERGDAYVCSLSRDEIIEQRGSPTVPGTNSPFRDRSVEENLDLFHTMQAGGCADGSHVLRAKVDMASSNMHLRDPVLYSMRDPAQHPHFRTKDRWRVFPSYDFTHCLSDALEGITHSFCTLEFQDHRPIYDWLIDRFLPSNTFRLHCETGGINGVAPHRDTYKGPRQTEFARLQLSRTITSKRKLKLLVEGNAVDGWDDPRMPTIAGMRERGVPPTAIRNFCHNIGVARADSGPVDVAMFEAAVRKHLDDAAPRAMAVVDPLRVVITNWPADKGSEILDVPLHPKNKDMGSRQIPFERELFIEREDFLDEPHNKKYKRLSEQQPVRLRGGYVIHCEGVERDAEGNIESLQCRYDETTLGRKPQGYKCGGVIHWVPAEAALDAEVHSYEHLFKENPPAPASDADAEEVASASDDSDDLFKNLTPDSHTVQTGCLVEPSVGNGETSSFQFERVGYFSTHGTNSDGRLVCRKITDLRSTFK